MVPLAGPYRRFIPSPQDNLRDSVPLPIRPGRLQLYPGEIPELRDSGKSPEAIVAFEERTNQKAFRANGRRAMAQDDEAWTEGKANRRSIFASLASFTISMPCLSAEVPMVLKPLSGVQPLRRQARHQRDGFKRVAAQMSASRLEAHEREWLVQILEGVRA
jgi:hypothetical protein